MTLQNSEPLVTLLDCASQSAVLYEKEFYSLRGGAVSKSVRVSTLAKELNMTSKEVVALCKELGIGATSASSNMVDAQADRVRRFAVDRGLKREGPPVKPQRASTAAVGREVPRPPGYSVNDPETNEDMEYEDDISDDNPGGGSPPPNDITPPNQPPHTPDNSKGREDDKNNKFINWWKDNWVRCLHVLPILVLFPILKEFELISTGNALEWWSGFLLFHIILGALISLRERKMITKKLRKHLKDLSHANERGYNDVEGSQSFGLLVVSIHGIAAVAGATISYFVIASFFNKELESYIFLNNEGAIAAITLIIVVASAAVVAVYVELAKSVRQQIDTYEVEISTLSQVLVEINDYAEQVWRHFDSVAHTMLQEWKKVLELQPHLLSRGRISDLERPLQLMASLQEFTGREFQKIDDREFWQHDDRNDLQALDQESDVNESYGRIENLEHSRHRYRHSMNLGDSGENGLSEEEQRRRARRLRYLGWSDCLDQHGLTGVIEVLNISNEWRKAVKPLYFAAHRIEKNPRDLVPVGDRPRLFLEWLVESGLLGTEQSSGNESHSRTDESLLTAAVAGTRNLRASKFRKALSARLGDGAFANTFKQRFFRADDGVDESRYSEWLGRLTNASVTPSDGYERFVTAHEKSLTYVMRELERSESDGEFINYAIRDFDRRVWNGQLNRTVSLEARQIEGGPIATLNKLCAQLDLDPSVFIDDLEVFIHLRGLVAFAPESTDNTTANMGENTQNEGTKTPDSERIALYKYAAYSRFVFYTFWFVEGPARLRGFRSASSQTNMKELKDWIDQKTSETATSDSATEFLLLMLADQRSALFNWLRSVRACTVRKSLFDYEKELDKEQQGPRRHFGIEVIPARHKRLTELQAHLKVGDQAQKPIRLRSVYDLVPRQSFSAMKRLPERNSDQRYVDTYRFISISKSWEDRVAIPAQDMQRVFGWLQNRKKLFDVTVDNKRRAYLEWLVNRVFPANRAQPDLRPSEETQLAGDALLLVQALWLVSPTFKAKFQRRPVPSIASAGEVEQYRAMLRQISTYCLDPNNADDMKNTFFGGADSATRRRAKEEYDKWLTDFRQRTIATTEGN